MGSDSTPASSLAALPAGIVLAGGRSTRFGSDKASAALAGRPLLEWVVAALSRVCREVVVVRARSQQLPEVECSVPLRIVDDVFDALGPVAGLVAGFRTAGDGLVVAASCDAPLLQPALLTALLSAAASDGRAATCGRVAGRRQPLPGVYRVEACLAVFERRVAEGRLALQGVLDDLDTGYLEEAELRQHDAGLLSYRGANTPAELAALEALVRDQSRTAG